MLSLPGSGIVVSLNHAFVIAGSDAIVYLNLAICQLPFFIVSCGIAVSSNVVLTIAGSGIAVFESSTECLSRC